MSTESAVLYCSVDPTKCTNILEKACRDNHEQIAQATGTPIVFGLLEVDKNGKLLQEHKKFVGLKDNIKDLKDYELLVGYNIYTFLRSRQIRKFKEKNLLNAIKKIFYFLGFAKIL